MGWLGQKKKTGKKKFVLLMSDPLMDWFRDSDDGELCPRIDVNLSCELQRVLCVSRAYTSQSALLNETI